MGVDAAGFVYVADCGNSVIRKITPVGTNWVVNTLAGTLAYASPEQLGGDEDALTPASAGDAMAP